MPMAHFSPPTSRHILTASSNTSGRLSSSGPGSIPSQPGGSSLSRNSLISFRKASSSAVERKSMLLLSVPATFPVPGPLSHDESQHHQSTTPQPSPAGSTTP